MFQVFSSLNTQCFSMVKTLKFILYCFQILKNIDIFKLERTLIIEVETLNFFNYIHEIFQSLFQGKYRETCL